METTTYRLWWPEIHLNKKCHFYEDSREFGERNMCSNSCDENSEKTEASTLFLPIAVAVSCCLVKLTTAASGGFGFGGNSKWRQTLISIFLL